MTDTNDPLVSVIIPVKNEGGWIQKTIDSLWNVKTTIPFEVIVVDNGSDDGCCDFLSSWNKGRLMLLKERENGIAKARNAGARVAKGDYFIFCDGHLLFEDCWMEQLIEPLQTGVAEAVNPCIADVNNPSRMGFGYTWGKDLTIRWNAGLPKPFPSPFLAGGCLAIRRDVFVQVDGFDRQFRGWGYDDQEISLKLWLFGYRCFVQPKVKVFHFFRNSSPPYPFSVKDIYYNFLRMAYLHFHQKRIAKCKELVKRVDINEIEQNVLESDALEVRKKYQLLRTYDDDWFMQRFCIPF